MSVLRSGNMRFLIKSGLRGVCVSNFLYKIDGSDYPRSVARLVLAMGCCRRASLEFTLDSRNPLMLRGILIGEGGSYTRQTRRQARVLRCVVVSQDAKGRCC